MKDTSTVDREETEEIRQLRHDLISLTSQLDQTKQAWREYQQTQLNILRNQLQHCLPINDDASFDEIVQQIVDEVVKEREDFSDKYRILERENENLRSGQLILPVNCDVYCVLMLYRIAK